MNKALAYAWADELDSGEHTQGKDSLERTDEYGGVKRCCLGVAVRMCALPADLIYTFDDGIVKFAGSETILSETLQKRLGIKTSTGIISSLTDRNGMGSELTELNDGGFTFPQIADVIRYFYEEL
jgi:hypothetical protein